MHFFRQLAWSLAFGMEVSIGFNIFGRVSFTCGESERRDHVTKFHLSFSEKQRLNLETRKWRGARYSVSVYVVVVEYSGMNQGSRIFKCFAWLRVIASGFLYISGESGSGGRGNVMENGKQRDLIGEFIWLSLVYFGRRSFLWHDLFQLNTDLVHSHEWQSDSPIKSQLKNFLSGPPPPLPSPLLLPSMWIYPLLLLRNDLEKHKDTRDE